VKRPSNVSTASITASLSICQWTAQWDLSNMKGRLVQGRTVAVKFFVKTNPITTKQVVSNSNFADVFVPTHNTLILWVSKWHEERSARDRDQQDIHSLSICLTIQIK
jgi:hypothetical protein